MNIINDMPKLQSPFVRKLNEKGEYLVTPEIDSEQKWVFEDETVICTEKIHGTNVSIIIERGQVVAIYNRTEYIPFINKGKRHIIEAVLESYSRGYLDGLSEGQFWGEVVGPKLNGNPYHLDKHLWIPFFTYARKHLAYKKWGAYPKDFETISKWFESPASNGGLMPLFSLNVHGSEASKNLDAQFVEGVVFVQPSTGKMSKLRKDMFSFWKKARHKEMEDVQ